jgi:hypothetical protein
VILISVLHVRPPLRGSILTTREPGMSTHKRGRSLAIETHQPRRHAVCRQALRLHFRRERVGLRYRRAVDSAVRIRGEYRLWIGICLPGDSRRAMGVWEETVVKLLSVRRN